MSRSTDVPFEAILRRTHPPDEAEDTRSTRVAPWYVPPFRDAGVDPDDAASARPGYVEDQQPHAEPAPPPRSITAEDILAELDLDACEDLAALHTRRRAFARDNHPDCVPTDLRENATTRMMIANGLIDTEIARRR